MSTLTQAAGSTLPLRVPWTTVVGCVAVAGVGSLPLQLMSATSDPTFVVLLAQLSLAASAAYLVDDASVAITSVAPRPLWVHRLLPLAIGLSTIAIAWSVVLLDLRRFPGIPNGLLSLEVAVLVALSVAVSAVVASYGEPEPGNSVAVVMPLAGVAAIVVGGLLDFSPLPSSAGAGYTGTAAAWTVAGVVALTTLALASRD